MPSHAPLASRQLYGRSSSIKDLRVGEEKGRGATCLWRLQRGVGRSNPTLATPHAATNAPFRRRVGLERRRQGLDLLQHILRPHPGHARPHAVSQHALPHGRSRLLCVHRCAPRPSGCACPLPAPPLRCAWPPCPRRPLSAAFRGLDRGLDPRRPSASLAYAAAAGSLRPVPMQPMRSPAG